MKLRVYLDTTVFSAAEDSRTPDRQILTLGFFDKAAEYDLSTSELTRQELSATPEPGQRQRLLARLDKTRCQEITDEMRSLAHEYVRLEIMPAAYIDDALHIAIAVLSRQDVLLSWNFRHMVNRRRRSLVNLFNTARSLPTIEILAPAEL